MTLLSGPALVFGFVFGGLLFPPLEPRGSVFRPPWAPRSVYEASYSMCNIVDRTSHRELAETKMLFRNALHLIRQSVAPNGCRQGVE